MGLKEIQEKMAKDGEDSLSEEELKEVMSAPPGEESKEEEEVDSVDDDVEDPNELVDIEKSTGVKKDDEAGKEKKTDKTEGATSDEEKAEAAKAEQEKAEKAAKEKTGDEEPSEEKKTEIDIDGFLPKKPVPVSSKKLKKKDRNAIENICGDGVSEGLAVSTIRKQVRKYLSEKGYLN